MPACARVERVFASVDPATGARLRAYEEIRDEETSGACELVDAKTVGVA